MNLLQARMLDQIHTELNELLKRCHTNEQIVTHFSQYLLGQLAQGYIEGYDFYPEYTPTQTLVRVHVFFIWDLGARHELVIKKDDCPGLAYQRAMGVI